MPDKLPVPNILIFTLCTVSILYVIRKMRELKWGRCRNDVKLDERIAIITGANSGIGYVVAKHLALRHAQVILACRNVDSAQEAIARIEKELKIKPNLTAMKLDLSNLKSVEEFATQIKDKYPQIHILINNAGVAYPKKRVHYTKDGFEIHMGVNHLGHFHLTNLLLPTLKATKGSRIVVVSSMRHEKGNISNIDSRNFLTEGDLYANSKLANVYFAQELAKRVPEVNVYALCPGWVYTSLFRHSLKWFHFVLMAPVVFLFMRTPEQGCQTVLYCATEPSLENESGLLYRDCKRYESKLLFEDSVGTKLWNLPIEAAH